jgi:hypothetical protein
MTLLMGVERARGSAVLHRVFLQRAQERPLHQNGVSSARARERTLHQNGEQHSFHRDQTRILVLEQTVLT